MPLRRLIRRFWWGALPAALLCAAMVAPASADPLGFGKIEAVDPGLAGGEPFVFADRMHGTLIYTSHEGTTHLYRDGLTTTEPSFLTNYRNQVNIWNSTDNGATWKFTNYLGTGFATDPTVNTGFSDPDLTQDAGGRIYNTGIDLANDALFSTSDGGKTWNQGTLDCHDGDRPWLAGGKADEVWLATDASVPDDAGNSGHVIYHSTDGGKSCSTTSLPDPGGDGKLLYVRSKDSLVEAHCCSQGLSVSRWHRGDPGFTDGKPVFKGQVYAHWPAMALDSNDTLYIVWDAEARANDGGGCTAGTGSPVPNQIQYAFSKDLGATWSKPYTVAAPAAARVLWPWITAGDAGRINIVWYQTDHVVDPDCETSKVFIWSSTILNADDPATRTAEPVNASGRFIHEGGVCQGGTGCVASGQDRRLGDFFTNDVLPNGCVMIASGDTTTHDPITGGPLPTSLPIFIRQVSGPALRGGGDCSGRLQPSPLPPLLSGRCTDHKSPISRIDRRGTRASRTRLALSGTARDRGCGDVAGTVARVSVAVGRVLGSRKCRFLRSNGAFTPARSCRRPRFLRARGTTNWHFNFVGSFPRGHYQIMVRATDLRRNIERVGKRNTLRVTVR